VIEAGPGERVVMPPGWADYVVNAETHNSFSEHVVIANMDSSTRKCVRTTDSPGSRYSATVAKLIGTPIQITWLPSSDGEKRETIRNLGCQPLCRSMNRFVSTWSPSSGSAIPRDLLPCGATSNLDGMTATNSRSRPPANSRLMVSRKRSLCLLPLLRRFRDQP
jgi:hypothetical protein